MRDYYEAAFVLFPNQIRDPDLRRRVNKFQSRYGNYGNGIFIKKFLGYINVPCIYAYSDSNRLYEFFSQKQIGVITSEPQKYIDGLRVKVSNEFRIPFIRPCSASAFADKIRPIASYSEKIGEVIKEYLELIRLVDLSNAELGKIEHDKSIDEAIKKSALDQEFLDGFFYKK